MSNLQYKTIHHHNKFIKHKNVKKKELLFADLGLIETHYMILISELYYSVDVCNVCCLHIFCWTQSKSLNWHFLKLK